MTAATTVISRSGFWDGVMAETVAGFQDTVNRPPAYIHHQDTKTPRENSKKNAKAQRRKDAKGWWLIR